MSVRDPNIAALDVQNRVSIANTLLPDDVKRLGLVTRKRTSSILLLVAMYSPGGTHSVTFVDNYTNIFVRDALLRVSGVGDILTRETILACVYGWNRITGAARPDADDVTNALAKQNLQIAAGAVGAPPQKNESGIRIHGVTNSRLNSEEQFGDIIVRANTQEGSAVHLKDVARIQLGKFSYANNSFVDGRRASYLLIFQAPGSNALTLQKAFTAPWTS